MKNKTHHTVCTIPKS